MPINYDNADPMRIRQQAAAPQQMAQAPMVQNMQTFDQPMQIGSELETPPLAAPAADLASRGRMGDDMLVHMNREEVAGLAALSPIGGLTQNPDTGMPEAFAFLFPMLGGLAGSALAPAAGSALLYGAIGSGLGGVAQGLLSGESLGRSLGRGLLGGLMSYGLGSAFNSFMTPGTSAATDAAATAGNLAATQSAAAPSAGYMAGFGGNAMGPGAMGTDLAAGYGASSVGPAAMGGDLGLGYGAPPPVSTTNVGSPFTRNLPTNNVSIDPTTAPVPQLSDYVNTTGFTDRLSDQLSLDSMLTPASLGRTAGQFATSSLMPIEPEDQIGSPIAPKVFNYTRNEPEPGDTEITLPPDGYVPGRDRQHSFYQNRTIGFNTGGMVPAPQGGVPGAAEDQQIIIEAKMALLDRHPEPQVALMRFAQRFGEEALRELVRGVTLQNPDTRMVEGPGHSMSDSVPAVIDGQQPAALSPGEVVIPADVVAGASADGTNVEEGAAKFKQLADEIRMARTGTTEQAPPFDPQLVGV